MPSSKISLYNISSSLYIPNNEKTSYLSKKSFRVIIFSSTIVSSILMFFSILLFSSYI
ncbi:MAG: hypothetical protein HRT42_12665 [Campylobacteraceae bacterium]|nr:hypothetical protein [Campylobacteraceae bacterium]